MSQEKATIHPIGSPTSATPPPIPTQKATKPKASQVLPSGKITITRQLALLRAYAATSGQNAKPVKTTEVSEVAKTLPSTISTANPFFVATGMLERTERGFIPSAEVLAFAHAYEWDSTDTTASHKLAPLIAPTWFAQEILKKLSFDKLTEADAITALAQYASVPPDCKQQVKVLIEYLDAVGIVQRDGDYLKKGTSAIAKKTERQASAPAGTPPPPPTEPEHRDAPHREAQPARSSVSSAFSQMTGGNVQFNVTVKVDMKEFAGWQADRIAAFFGGIAQVLAAKGALEVEASQE